MVRAGRRVDDRDDHDHAHQEREGRIGRRVQLAVGERVARGEEDGESGKVDQKLAEIAEQGAAGDDGGALLVVVGHLGPERHVRHGVQGHQHARGDAEDEQPDEEAGLGVHPGVESEVDGDGHGHGRPVHEGVAPTPPRAPAVGDRTHQRVGDGVHGHGDHQGEAAEAAGQAEHLVVVEQEEQGEDRALLALRHLAHPVGELGVRAQVPGARHAESGQALGAGGARGRSRPVAVCGNRVVVERFCRRRHGSPIPGKGPEPTIGLRRLSPARGGDGACGGRGETTPGRRTRPGQAQNRRPSWMRSWISSVVTRTGHRRPRHSRNRSTAACATSRSERGGGVRCAMVLPWRVMTTLSPDSTSRSSSASRALASLAAT